MELFFDENPVVFPMQINRRQEIMGNESFLVHRHYAPPWGWY
jgi:hypothetical protein